LERTSKLRFALKAHRVFTHKRSYSQEDVKKFLYSIEPIANEERLIAILFQFPNSFGYSAEALSYIEKLSEDFRGFDRALDAL
jgi:uncharacterized protein YecE (DUF72 family)